MVSGSALGTSGQISVFHYQLSNGNYSGCYRCVFPKQLKTTQNCSDNGVLGPLTGMIGSLQAMEVLKIIMKKSEFEVYCNRLLMVDLMSGIFHSMKYSRKEDCLVCGNNSTITLQNYFDFVVVDACEKDNNNNSINNISCSEYNENIVCLEKPHILLDVRNDTQFRICSLPNSTSKFFKNTFLYLSNNCC